MSPFEERAFRTPADLAAVQGAGRGGLKLKRLMGSGVDPRFSQAIADS